MTAPSFDAMRRALGTNDASAVRELLERHEELRAAVNEPLFPFDSPALVHVAPHADEALLDVLLEFGADPNQRSDWWAGGFHPLHSANDRAAARLIAAGAIPDACAAAHLDRPDLLARIIEDEPARVHERGGDGQTPLHFARSRAIVDMLLDAGAALDARDIDHRSTPAQWMLDRRRGAGRYELAGYLVERGATADIFLAAALGLGDRVHELLHSNPSLLDLRTAQGDYAERPPSSFHIYMWTIGANLSPMQVAAQFEQHDTLRVMREAATPGQRLVFACARGDAGEARALLLGNPRLVESLRAIDSRALPDAAWTGQTAAVSLMLELGFDPMATGQDGGTALHCAAWQGVSDSVAAILRHPARRALVERRESTHGGVPLDWCCHGSQHRRNPAGDYPAIARMLLEAGSPRPRNLDVASDAVRAVIEAFPLATT
jgi:ankyrin repeat protein